jgi:hypothetical protein
MTRQNFKRFIVSAALASTLALSAAHAYAQSTVYLPFVTNPAIMSPAPAMPASNGTIPPASNTLTNTGTLTTTYTLTATEHSNVSTTNALTTAEIASALNTLINVAESGDALSDYMADFAPNSSMRTTLTAAAANIVANLETDSSPIALRVRPGLLGLDTLTGPQVTQFEQAIIAASLGECNWDCVTDTDFPQTVKNAAAITFAIINERMTPTHEGQWGE